MLFAELACPQNLIVGLAVWRSVQSDRTQREMLRDAAAVAVDDKRRFERINWAIREVDYLSDVRNDLAHTAIAVVAGPKALEPIPNPLTTRPGTMKRLTSVDTDKRVNAITGDLNQLANFIASLTEPSTLDIPNTGTVSWWLPARRPRLRTREMLGDKRPTKRQGRARSKPKAPS